MSTDLDIDFLDLDEIGEAPPTVPTDTYSARVVEAEVRVTKDGQSKYVSYAIVITDGEYAGRRVYGMWSLKPENLWRMKRDFNRMGYAPAGGTPSVAELIGLEGYANVVIQQKVNSEENENRIRGWAAGK